MNLRPVLDRVYTGEILPPLQGAGEVRFHPLANLFPLIVGKEFEELVAAVFERGLRKPIILHQGMILDGRNRYRACLAAGVNPVFRLFG